MSERKETYWSGVYHSLKKRIKKLEEENKELKERNEILVRELKIIYDSNGKTYYDLDRIKILVKANE